MRISGFAARAVERPASQGIAARDALLMPGDPALGLRFGGKARYDGGRTIGDRYLDPEGCVVIF